MPYFPRYLVGGRKWHREAVHLVPLGNGLYNEHSLRGDWWDGEMAKKQQGLDVDLRPFGQGRPVLFLHGLGLDRRQWQQEMKFYEGKRPAAALSLPGQGASERPTTERLGIGLLADAVLRWMEARAWSSVHVVGCSLGGLVAWELSQRQPQRLASVLTFGSAPKLSYPPLLVQPSAWLLDWWLAGRHPQKYAAIAAKGSTKDAEVQEQLQAAFQEAASQWRQSVYELRLAISQYDYVPLLQTTTVPTLLVRAQHDTAVNKVIDKTRQRWGSNKRVYVTKMDQAGHVANWDRPEAFLAVMSHWINEVDRQDEES